MNKGELSYLLNKILGATVLVVGIIPALIFGFFFHVLPSLALLGFFAGIITIPVYYLFFKFIPFEYIWLALTILLFVAIYFPELITKEKSKDD